MPLPPPFTIQRPAAAAGLLYDSPHSGRAYPDHFPAGSPPDVLRRAEDAYVDELVSPGVQHGAILLAARYARAFIDLNRAPDDIDAELLAEPWPTPLNPTEKSRRGQGLIRRFAVPGFPVHARTLSVAEVQWRITEIYQPYHDALESLIAELRGNLPRVLHVDWHSMKSRGNAMTPDGATQRSRDFVVSDRDGASAAPEVTALVRDTLQSLGYRVSVNDPYKGGAIVQRIGDPAHGVHSVQIEINRALYLDELRVEKTAGFEPLRADVLRLTQRLADSVTRS